MSIRAIRQRRDRTFSPPSALPPGRLRSAQPPLWPRRRQVSSASQNRPCHRRLHHAIPSGTASSATSTKTLEAPNASLSAPSTPPPHATDKHRPHRRPNTAPLDVPLAEQLTAARGTLARPPGNTFRFEPPASDSLQLETTAPFLLSELAERTWPTPIFNAWPNSTPSPTST